MKPKNHNLYIPNPGLENQKNDLKIIEHGRERFSGFLIGKSSFPCFFNADGHTVHLEDSARGNSVMIMMEDSEVSDALYKTTTWNLNSNIGMPDFLTITNPINIYDKILSSTKTTKILPLEYCEKTNHNPFCFYYIRNDFLNEGFLLEETINANEYITIIKLAYIMGFRNICFNGEIKNPSLISKYFNIASELGLKINITVNCDELNEYYITINEAYEKCISYT